jgi:hypothetical protein
MSKQALAAISAVTTLAQQNEQLELDLGDTKRRLASADATVQAMSGAIRDLNQRLDEEYSRTSLRFPVPFNVQTHYHHPTDIYTIEVRPQQHAFRFALLDTFRSPARVERNITELVERVAADLRKQLTAEFERVHGRRRPMMSNAEFVRAYNGTNAR